MKTLAFPGPPRAAPRRWLLAACCGLGFFWTTPGLGQVPPHHREGGYQNNHEAFAPKGLPAVVQWKLRAAREGLPKPPNQPTPVVAPDVAALQANAKAGAHMRPTATWIGHASWLLQLGGVNVLADPIFSARASPLPYFGPKRAQPPGLALSQLPHIDLVVISHNHYDHLDLPSLLALEKQAGGAPLVVVPLGNKAWLLAEGLSRVAELDWWQSLAVADLRVVATPVQHWSGRTLSDRMQTLWAGYALLAPQARVFFAGDTGYTPDFTAIAQRLDDDHNPGAPVFDLALLPIGAYEPRSFMRTQHMNPADAVMAHRDLRARLSVGMHWGTFELTDESLDEPPRALAAARREAGVRDQDFIVMAIGQTLTIPAPAP